ncbi:UDP-N-acetylmuramate--L-alanine ligase [Candidatus Magnetoovum chiemensis]|nr:UDP-N-acetylmuramate--L-alanine ligase [Candidatus Magnetoovum chiemensis]
MFNQYRIVHFVGIGGIGMSGIAEVLHSLGYTITGSDVKISSTIEHLLALGIKVHIGHKAQNIDDAHVVVISSAIRDNNPEVIEAKQRAIPVIPRAEMLAELGRLKYSILIAGSHGKTTTTSLISTILINAKYDPTVVIGGKLASINTNAACGKGQYFVAEADESDGSFLKLNPTIAVCTNIDREHMDFFHSMEELKKYFTCFLNKVPFYGHSVVCNEDPNIVSILPHINRRYMTYGFNDNSDFYVKDVKSDFFKTEFTVYRKNESLGRFLIPISGAHNILNSTASIAVAASIEIDMDVIKESLSTFKGIKRRLEFKGNAGGIKVYDDYGHHPTEIQTTLKGVKETISDRLLIVFQPHRYSRTKDLMQEFGRSFYNADKVYLLDVYSAGEEPLNGANSETLCKLLQDNGVNTQYLKTKEEAINRINTELKEGDFLITLGAGDVWTVGEKILKQRN